MNIGIDIRKIGHFGIGTYVSNLVRSMAEAGRDNHYVLFGDPAVRSQYASNESITVVPNTTKQYSIVGMHSLARQADAGHIDVFHTPHYVLPMKMKARTVVTINDIIPLLFPEYFGIHKRAFAWTMMRRSCLSADRVIAISSTTANDLRERFSMSDDRLRVVPLGVHKRFRPMNAGDKARMRAKYSLPEGYLLYSGALKPHKNVPRLLSALAQIPAGRRPPLVLIGDDPQTTPGIAAVVDRFRLSSCVMFLGKLQDDEIAGIYGAAGAFIHPSLYEGFGLTVLEAMASEIPVATSGAGSLTEVVGDAALIFDPLNENAIAGAIERITGDSALRSRLVEKGKIRVASFSWEQCAKSTLAVYRELDG